MNVLDTNTTEITYSYTGNDNFTFWLVHRIERYWSRYDNLCIFKRVVDVVAGTVVTFEVIDSTQLSVTSTPITVLVRFLDPSIA